MNETFRADPDKMCDAIDVWTGANYVGIEAYDVDRGNSTAARLPWAVAVELAKAIIEADIARREA